jgi:uncharacterized delta-60 repeat protein
VKKKSIAQSAFFNLCLLLRLLVFFSGVLLGLLAAANPQVLAHDIARDLGKQTSRFPDGITLAPSGGVHEAWVARYDHSKCIDDPEAIAVDGSGNVYVTGSTYPSDNSVDSVTIKYDSAGQEQWVAIYGADSAQAIAVDGSGNVYVTGFSFGSSGGTGSDYVTIKYDSAGREQWVAVYSGPANGPNEAVAIAVDGSGNVYVTGVSPSAFNDNDYATIKYNSAGQEQWVARYDHSSGIDDAAAIIVDASGNVYVTGDSGSDYATIKYNSAGQEQWVARYNGPGNDADGATAIAIDDSGNVYVTGFSVGSGTDYDYATIKYNSAGQEQWVARYNGPGNDWDLAGSIAVDALGNVYVTGESIGARTNYDYATIKYNASGQEEWVARYNGPGNLEDSPAAVGALAIDDSGNVYVTGFSVGSGTDYDYATIKYNSAGQEQWVARYNGPGKGLDGARALALDESGNVYVTGISFGAGTNYDYATIKYVQGATPTPTPTPSVTPTPTTTPTPTPAPRLRPTPWPRPTPAPRQETAIL